MTALEQAYASNNDTTLWTLEISHSAITGGLIRLVRAYQDLEATLEDSSIVTFTAAGVAIAFPKKTTDGRQDLQFQLDNASREIFQELKAVKTANRTTEEKTVLKFREFLESDTSSPAGAVYTLNVSEVQINNRTAYLKAIYTPIPDMVYPRLRYFPTNYPGLKYV